MHAARTDDSAREVRPSWVDETTADTTCAATAAVAPVTIGAPCSITEYNSSTSGNVGASHETKLALSQTQTPYR